MDCILLELLVQTNCHGVLKGKENPVHTETAQEKPASPLAEIVKLVPTMLSGGLLGKGEEDEMLPLSTVADPMCCPWAVRRTSALQVDLCHVTALLCNSFGPGP